MNPRLLLLVIVLAGPFAVSADPDAGWVAMSIALGLYALAPIILALICVVALIVGIPYWVAVGFQVRRCRKDLGRSPSKGFWWLRVSLFVVLVFGITGGLLAAVLRLDIKERGGAKPAVAVLPKVVAPSVTWPDTLLMSLTNSARVTAYDDLNKQPIVFYGLAVDEKTNAIAGAIVHADISKRSLTGASGERFQLTTDSTGHFTITEKEGETLGVVLTKRPDYHDSHSGLYHYSQLYGPKRHQPNPNLPVVFMLQKVKGPEPLVFVDRAFGAPNTGELVRVDLTTGQIVPSGGDLIVSIEVLKPFRQGNPVPWKMHVEAIGGGFIRDDDVPRVEYMHEAPVDGYEPTIEISYGHEGERFEAQFDGHYYLSSRNGQVFTKLRFRMNISWDERGVPFGIVAFVNTNASRNLEVPLWDDSNVIDLRNPNRRARR